MLLGLQIDVAAASEAPVLRMSGDLDADSADSLIQEGERLVAEGHRDLILDCAGLTFCDSFGLRAMALLLAQVQPDGSVTITHPSDMLSRILQITGLAEQFQIVNGSG